MERRPLFCCSEFALLRAPVHPVSEAGRTRGPDPAADTGRDAQEPEDRQLAAALRDMADDPLLREAVAVSSPSLSRRWEEFLRGERAPKTTELRRALRALTAYRLRMTTRATPFGLMAGVALAELTGREGEIRETREVREIRARLGTAHRRTARPDRRWLTALVTGWERRPEVLGRLRVTANNLCFVRGGRLVLPYVPARGPAEEDGATAGPVREVSVRHTPAVRAALERARTPVALGELAAQLRALHPEAPGGAVDGMLAGLVEKEMLLTELRPPADTADPAGHVLAVLDALAPGELPELDRLREVCRGLESYAARPLGEGRAAWEAVCGGMRGLAAEDRPVQVDLALDADVRLPAEVGREAERAAELLWRLAPDAAEVSPIVRYHHEFVERYGTDRPVPVTTLLDPERGLGAPAGYRQPPSHRPAPPPQPPDPERDGLLLELAAEALRTASVGAPPEVVLSDGHPFVRRLAREDGTPPPVLELMTRLAADSPEALRAGDFRLVVDSASDLACATFGRFAHLLPARARAVLTDLAAVPGAEPAAPDALRAQLVFHSAHGRGGNVAQTPRLLGERLPVGVFADGGLDLDELDVRADQRRLFLVRRGDGREIVPAMLHLLNTRSFAPNTARFLSEVPRSGVRGWRPWDWGAAEGLPHTPRVRYGRSVLVPARWRPPAGVRDQDAPFAAWCASVQAWRDRWAVPEHICLAYYDLRLELRLDEPAHLRLLRHELRRRPDALLFEVADAAPRGGGWLTGPGGVHRNELVFPLTARPRASRDPRDTGTGTPRPESADPPAVRATPPRSPLPRPHSRPHPRPVPAETEHLPGGEWLYALVHCGPERHDELLAAHLPRLLRALPQGVDRWFAVRYQDQGHHLRLRFHGEPGALAAQLLPGLHRWAADLRAHGLIQRLTLGTYEPELDRYGGPQAIEAAEEVFHADSRAALETLALRARAQGRLTLDPVVVAAAGYVHMAAAFPLADGGAGWEEWLLRTFPKGARHPEFQRRRRTALAVVDPCGGWAGLRRLPGGEELFQAWERRTGALREYGGLLRKLGPQATVTPEAVLPSLFHMHHNRLVGIDRDGERASLAIARGAVQAHRDRRRSMP